MGEITVAHDISHGLKANHQITTDGLRRRHTFYSNNPKLMKMRKRTMH